LLSALKSDPAEIKTFSPYCIVAVIFQLLSSFKTDPAEIKTISS